MVKNVEKLETNGEKEQVAPVEEMVETKPMSPAEQQLLKDQEEMKDKREMRSARKKLDAAFSKDKEKDVARDPEDSPPDLELGKTALEEFEEIPLRLISTKTLEKDYQNPRFKRDAMVVMRLEIGKRGENNQVVEVANEIGRFASRFFIKTWDILKNPLEYLPTFKFEDRSIGEQIKTAQGLKKSPFAPLRRVGEREEVESQEKLAKEKKKGETWENSSNY